jgi:hypothetical protein
MHKRTAHGIIESDDGTDIYLDEELAAQLFSGTKRKRANITVQPTEVNNNQISIRCFSMNFK